MGNLISIIIPTYNRSVFIGETLESILLQTYQDWECIVIDDHSTDHTDELMEFYCQKDSRIKYFSRPIDKKKGPNSCRNFGYTLSKGSYINWFDSDDLLLPKALEEKIRCIGNSDVIISPVDYVDYRGEPISLTHRYLSENIIEDYFVGKITFYTFTPLWKKEFLEKHSELFDENISNLDDWDFNLRMLYAKPDINYIHEPQTYYRLHENSLSREIYKLNYREIISEFKARKKHLNILRGENFYNLKNLEVYDMLRCKKIVRTAMATNHEKKFSLYKMLLKRQINLLDVKGIIKTSIGFISLRIFGKGDKLFR